jgi:hypothetical protein
MIGSQAEKNGLEHRKTYGNYHLKDVPADARKVVFGDSEMDAQSMSEYYHVDDMLSQHIWEVLKGRKTIMKKKDNFMDWNPN